MPDKKSNLPEEQKTGDTRDHYSEKTDPQNTELRGFTNPNEDLEPTLKDGTKSNEKAWDEHERTKDL